MNNIINKLNDLRRSVVNGEHDLEEIQSKLSVLLLDNCSSIEQEKAAKKFDNDLELIIYTLPIEEQMGAAIKVIDEAISFISA